VSLDHLVGDCQKAGRDRQAERPGGFEVNYLFVLGRRLHGQFGRPRAFENAVDTCEHLKICWGARSSMLRTQACFSTKALPPSANDAECSKSGLHVGLVREKSFCRLGGLTSSS